jgi:hypothetical protein
VNDNVSARVRRLHAGEILSERRGAVSNQRIVLDVTGRKKLGRAFRRLA